MIVIIMCLCLSPAPCLETSHWLDSTLPPVTLSLSNHTATALTSNQSCSGDDEVFKYRAYTVTYLLVFPIALLFNSGALFVFLRLKPKRSPSSIFMTNLALSDACFSLTLPFRLAYYLRGAHWDLPDWLCRLCVFCFYLNLYTRYACAHTAKQLFTKKHKHTHTQLL